MRLSPVFTRLRQIQAARRPSEGGSVKASADDVIDKIARLAELHEKGALTDAEFATLKAKLIG